MQRAMTRVVHGTDSYVVTGEVGKYLTVYPEREMPHHPGNRQHWPSGVPWFHVAARYAVEVFCKNSGIPF